MCVSHHMGKNPYDSLDPLGLSNQYQRAEWKSLVWVTGAQRRPSTHAPPASLHPALLRLRSQPSLRRRPRRQRR